MLVCSIPEVSDRVNVSLARNWLCVDFIFKSSVVESNKWIGPVVCHYRFSQSKTNGSETVLQHSQILICYFRIFQQSSCGSILKTLLVVTSGGGKGGQGAQAPSTETSVCL